MNNRRNLQERLGELGQAIRRDPTLRARVMDRIARADRITTLDLLRLWLADYSSVLTVWVVGLTALIVAHLFGTPPAGPAAAPRAWFYDTVTAVLYTDDATKVSPTLSPAGNLAVRAHLFSCGSCAEEERFTGYYERYTEPLKRAMEADPDSATIYELWLEGREYSTDAVNWVPAASARGVRIAASNSERCAPDKLRYCPPK